RNTVDLSSTWNSVSSWGAGVSGGAYTFTGTDAGSHTFAVTFGYPGDQTATVKDRALASRTVTTSPIAVTNSAPVGYAHDSVPSGVSLADGGVVASFVGITGRLWARRFAGTASEPIWGAPVLVREALGASIGADSPSLARLG